MAYMGGFSGMGQGAQSYLQRMGGAYGFGGPSLPRALPQINPQYASPYSNSIPHSGYGSPPLIGGTGGGQPMPGGPSGGFAMPGGTVPFTNTITGTGQYRMSNGDGTFKSIPNVMHNIQIPGAGGGAGYGGGAGGYGGSLSKAYQDAFNANKAQYDKIVGGGNQFIGARPGQQFTKPGQNMYGRPTGVQDNPYNNYLAASGGGYKDRYLRNMMDLQGSGDQELKDINTGFDNRLSGINSDLTSRGLGASTVHSNLALGAEKERANALGQAKERIRQQRIGLDTQLSGDTLNFENSVQNPYPDMASYYQMLMNAGRAGYG